MALQFPPEVVICIVNHSLEHFDVFKTEIPHRPRYATLKNYSIINSTWMAISQPLLYESVVLQTPGALARFADAGKRAGGTMKGVKAMRISEAGREGVVEEVLSCVRGSLEGLFIAMLGIDVDELVRLERLRRLSILICDVYGSPNSQSFQFRHLHHLDAMSSSLPSCLMSPKSVPALRQFDTSAVALTYDKLRPLFPQLQACHIDDNRPLYEKLLPHAKSLLLLHLDSDSNKVLALSQLPFTPRFIWTRNGSPASIIAMLKERVESKESKPEGIFFPRIEFSAAIDRGGRAVVIDEIAPLVHALSARGVNAVFAVTNHDDAIETMNAVIRAKERGVAYKWY